ncbi:MAG: hypothetical protein OHK0026_13310 [Rhodocyclaceae bacterium]
MRDLHRLVAAVQRNCDIADARHARDMTICNYLLGMREYCAWESGLPPGKAPPREELSRWLAEREARWAELEQAPYAPLPLAGTSIGPFEARAANRALLPEGLVYGAGYGRFGKPHFFLGRLASREEREGLEVLVADCEYARDITGVVAALQGETIVLRREVLSRWLWDKYEAWSARRPEGALEAALGHYGFERDPAAALERMTAGEAETLVLHELGEARAGRLLGGQWESMLAALGDRRAEILARAVRDNLADCLSTLPALLERDARPSIHFFFSNFDGMRRALFPRLVQAYRAWAESGSTSALGEAAEAGSAHWIEQSRRILALHAAGETLETLAAGDPPAIAL